MRIARVLTRLNLGGPARQVLASDPMLMDAGHSVRIFAGQSGPGEGDLFEAMQARGLDVVRVDSLARGLSFTGDLRAARDLRRAFEEFRPDIVHTHASKAGALGRRAARSVGKLPCVHTFHGHVLEGYFPAFVSRRLVAHERRWARRSARILAVSHATADDLIRLEVVPEDKLTVVPPGIDLAPFLELSTTPKAGELRKLLGAGPEDYLVAVVGRLAEVKRPEIALDVFEVLRARHPKLHLVFVGDGDQRAMLEGRIGALDADGQGRVHMLGNRTDMPSLLSEIDAVLLTSRSEGLPVALIEAGAAGRPVVSTPVGGVPELVAHERTGFLGESADELAFGLDQLVSRPVLGEEMGRRARLRIEKRHSARELARRLEAVYTGVLGGEPCAS